MSNSLNSFIEILFSTVHQLIKRFEDKKVLMKRSSRICLCRFFQKARFAILINFENFKTPTPINPSTNLMGFSNIKQHSSKIMVRAIGLFFCWDQSLINGYRVKYTIKFCICFLIFEINYKLILTSKAIIHKNNYCTKFYILI